MTGTAYQLPQCFSAQAGLGPQPSFMVTAMFWDVELLLEYDSDSDADMAKDSLVPSFIDHDVPAVAEMPKFKEVKAMSEILNPTLVANPIDSVAPLECVRVCPRE
jgi:hypothetical protein